MTIFPAKRQAIMTQTENLPKFREIARLIDISAVRTDSTDFQIAEVVKAAKKLGFFLVTVLPAQTMLAKTLLSDASTPLLGGNVGFPSGGQTTSIKTAEARELAKMGVNEIDMVINIAAHLSERFEDVYNDIQAVINAAEGLPVKVILECYYLNPRQIRIGCDLAIKAGAAFVKTGSGWSPNGADPETVSLIKQHVGDQIGIKASGGIRGMDMLLDLKQRGATRFGISLASAVKIFNGEHEIQSSNRENQEGDDE